jgi:hypothetical protein
VRLPAKSGRRSTLTLVTLCVTVILIVIGSGGASYAGPNTTTTGGGAAGSARPGAARLNAPNLGDTASCTGIAEYCLPDGLATVVWFTTGSGCRFDATVYWGDATGSSTVVPDFQNGQITTHQYTEPGYYIVSWTIMPTVTVPGSTCVPQPGPDGNFWFSVQVPGPAPNFLVNAGPDQNLHGAREVQLAGVAVGAATTDWSEMSGPANVTFSSGSPTATAAFTAPGTYVLRLTGVSAATDEVATDDMTVTIVDHYRVELKSWIPQTHVVDPSHLFELRLPTDAAGRARWIPDVPVRCRPTGWRHVTLDATFLGDGHVAYGGTARVSSWAEFDWDGKSVSAATGGINAASSTRDWKITNRDTGQVTDCQESGTRNGAVPAQVAFRANGFTIAYKVANDLLDSAPPLQATMAGTLTGNSMAINLTNLTRFPSHGFQVRMNGAVQATQTTQNVSCLPALGLIGAVTVGVGLLTFATPARYDVDLRNPSAEQTAACQ